MSSYNVGYGLTPLTAAVIRNFFDDVVAVVSAVGGSPSGIGLIAVATSGSNLGGNGQISNPLYINDVITVVDVHTQNLSASNKVTASFISVANNLVSPKITASCFFGDGNKITNLTASNITNFTADTRKQLSAGTNLNYDTANGVFNLNDPVSLSSISATSVTASFNGNGSQITNITSSNITNFIADTQAQFAAGTNLNYSSGVYALNNAINLTSVTASFNGNGSQITNLTASNIINFTVDVRAQLSAGQNINYTNGIIAFSGVLPVVNGGTGLSSAGSAANVLISDGTGLVSRTLSQDVTITSTGVATTKGLYTNPLRSPAVTAPSPGDFLKWGGTDWFPAPVAATVAIGSLALTADPAQTITANGQTILPTSAYWRINTAGNFNAGAINYVGAVLGQTLFIQVPIGQLGSITFNKGANLALGSNTRKINAGGSLQLIYDGTRWIEMFFNTSTST